MKKIISIVLLTISFLAMANKDIIKHQQKVNLLFVQIANSATLKPIKGKPGYYELTLKGVSDYVQYFSDRPARIAGVYPTKDFIQQWNKGEKTTSFKKMPPNAAFSAVQATWMKRKMVHSAFNLTHPVYNEQQHTLSYMIHVLPGMNKTLPMKRLNHVALFIDDYCASCVGHGF